MGPPWKEGEIRLEVDKIVLGNLVTVTLKREKREDILRWCDLASGKEIQQEG